MIAAYSKNRPSFSFIFRANTYYFYSRASYAVAPSISTYRRRHDESTSCRINAPSHLFRTKSAGRVILR